MSMQSGARPSPEALRAEAKRAIFVRCDMGEESEIEALARRAVDKFYALHIAFNNAGVPDWQARRTARGFGSIYLPPACWRVCSSGHSGAVGSASSTSNVIDVL
jgi:NAD(P)-dependent dehydrogenase (short-subunit alcohol dehydrogenase family)